jgi:hypothetical protein
MARQAPLHPMQATASHAGSESEFAAAAAVQGLTVMRTVACAGTYGVCMSNVICGVPRHTVCGGVSVCFACVPAPSTEAGAYY